MMQQLKAAVIGCGHIGTLHAQAMHQSRNTTLVAVCDSDRERAETVAQRFSSQPYYEFSELLQHESPEIVTVATPDHLHLDIVLAAISAGCHVFCEKPLATELQDAQQMSDAAAQRRVWLSVNYNRRYGFGYRKAKELIGVERIGEVRQAVISVTDRTPPSEVVREPTVILSTLLTHHIDLLRYFCGEVTSVHTCFSDALPNGLLTHVALSFQLASGAVGTIVAGYRDDQLRTTERMEIVGTQGSIVVEDVTRGVTLVALDADHVELFRPNHFIADDSFYATVTDHLQDFLEYIAEGREPPISGQEGVRGLQIVTAAVQSYREGKRVEV
jgi:predicted dehydrogenase